MLIFLCDNMVMLSNIVVVVVDRVAPCIAVAVAVAVAVSIYG